jgi:DNA-binding response OmpR family regulator
MTRRKRILIVDDDQGVCEALTFLLRDRYDVLVASRGADALGVVAREPVDLILLDWFLPDMLGANVLREVRAPFPELPIIVISVLQKEIVAHAAGAAGATFYMPKPFMVSELLAHIQLLIEPPPYRETPPTDTGRVEAPAPVWLGQPPNGSKPNSKGSRRCPTGTAGGARV